ncbi:MAG TPA: HAMP domain-containing sensor histidine kinase [Desulfurivibrionaceae bacterium]|jgi:signal transduction histidine kinase
MITISMLPVWLLDFGGAIALIILSGLCLKHAHALARTDRESPLAIFLLWFCGALFALALSRSSGHILNYLLTMSGRKGLWLFLAPYSGSINSMAFIIIASVTLFFNRIETIMERMVRDREKIEKNSQDLFRLNKEIEAVIAERTRASIALRIAHEVRNPVTIIGGMVRRLLNAYPAEEEGRLKLVHILDQARRLENLVSKFESVRPEAKKIFAPLDLNPIVAEAVESLQEEARVREVSLLPTLSQTPLFFHGNSSLIKIALAHLLRNAVNACGKKNRIIVTTEMTSAGCQVKITDDGPGISKEMLEVIFDPYLHVNRQSTGLGLPYVKQIINEHMGTVTVTSEQGKGATVLIVLPTHLGELTGVAGGSYAI